MVLYYFINLFYRFVMETVWFVTLSALNKHYNFNKNNKFLYCFKKIKFFKLRKNYCV